MAALIGLLLAALLCSCLLGPVELWELRPGVALAILLRLRLPRTLLAAAVGACLAGAGTTLQAILRNPLADPYVLGISGGAAVGAVLAEGLGLSPWCLAFPGGLATLGLILALGRRGGELRMERVILAGIMLNALCSALILVLLSVLPPWREHGLLFWLMGDLEAVGYGRPLLVAVPLALACPALPLASRPLDLLLLGDERARQLGLEVGRFRTTALVLSSLLTALAVAGGGIIGFVGLMVPHLLRLALGGLHRRLLPASLVGGAAFLALCDVLARCLRLPIGALTAILGVPFFLFLLRREGGWSF